MLGNNKSAGLINGYIHSEDTDWTATMTQDCGVKEVTPLCISNCKNPWISSKQSSVVPIYPENLQPRPHRMSFFEEFKIRWGKVVDFYSKLFVNVSKFLRNSLTKIGIQEIISRDFVLLTGVNFVKLLQKEAPKLLPYDMLLETVDYFHKIRDDIVDIFFGGVMLDIDWISYHLSF